MEVVMGKEAYNLISGVLKGWKSQLKVYNMNDKYYILGKGYDVALTGGDDDASRALTIEIHGRKEKLVIDKKTGKQKYEKPDKGNKTFEEMIEKYLGLEITVNGATNAKNVKDL